MFAAYNQGFFKKKEVEKKNLELIKVGFQADEYMFEALVDTATDKGYFAENGIKVEKVQNTNNLIAALSSGDLDVSLGANTVALLNFLNNQDTVFIDKLINRPPFTGVITRKGNRSELSKAAVAKLAGAGQIYTEVVKSNLGTVEEIDYSVAAIGAPQIAAIESGVADFTVTNVLNDDTKKAVKGKDLEIVSPDDTWKNKELPMGVISTKKLVESKKSSVGGFVKALNKAQEYALGHKKESVDRIKIISKYSESSSSEIFVAYAKTVSSSHKLDENSLKDVMEAVRTLKPKNASRNLSEYIDTQFVK